MNRSALRALVTLSALTLGVSALLTGPASAGEAAGTVVVGDWAALDTNTAPGETHWTSDAVTLPSVQSHIVNSGEARLVWTLNDQNNLGTSVEATGLNISVDAGQFISFGYEVVTGSAGGGAPRLFAVIDGAYYNTWDHPSPQFGSDPTEGILTVPVDGTVTALGIVYDNGVQGEVRVFSPIVGNATVLFETDDTEEAKNFGRIVSELAKDPDAALEHAKGKGALSKR